MAHIHLPEGTFTLLWVIIWWSLAAISIAVCIFWLRNVRKIDNRMITLAGLCTAAAFAVFQINIPLFGGVHLNLTPLVGILVGPAPGSIIVLIVNIFSAAIGHGGWGLIGANSLVNIIEVIAAYSIYRWMGRLNTGAFSRAGIATLVALFAGNAAVVAIIAVSDIQGVDQPIGSILQGLILLAGINMAVAVIEAIITGYIVSYIQKIRPDILRETKPHA